jgi:hypothetical protein
MKLTLARVHASLPLARFPNLENRPTTHNHHENGRGWLSNQPVNSLAFSLWTTFEIHFQFPISHFDSADAPSHHPRLKHFCLSWLHLGRKISLRLASVPAWCEAKSLLDHIFCTFVGENFLNRGVMDVEGSERGWHATLRKLGGSANERYRGILESCCILAVGTARWRRMWICSRGILDGDSGLMVLESSV